MEKQKNTFRISERKLRHIIKESAHEVLKEISYDVARKAYEKAVQSKDGRKKDSANLYGHLKNKAPQNVNMDMDVVVVGDGGMQHFKVRDLEDNFEVTSYVEPSQNPIYNNSPLIGMPRLKGFVGPMLDGDKIRYETQEAYDFFSA